MTGTALDIMSKVAPPRGAFVDHPVGRTFGPPHDRARHEAVLVKALEHPNRWVRLTAQRLLTEEGSGEAAERLVSLLTNRLAYVQVHALWTLQGERSLEVAEGEHGHTEYKWTQGSAGAQNEVQYDTTVRDLVNFLAYMGEPAATSRKRIGIVVLFALGILFIFAYALKKEYWKDVH